MVRRLFRVSESFRGRVRAPLIHEPIKAVPPVPLAVCLLRGVEPA